ncbi:uncharacterized protein K02A2.6-like [Dermacentor silvarum]|uniref:uncharacterized protein K02A2.6-like n=1 Tax=Dermacentor silvarum TaxID=543639 RepID=UPI00189820CB|nr:uncharacterized protein K02A2.6-like [Dermacentor silvarum]
MAISWSRIHDGFEGSFMGHYILVMVDAFSKWVEVHPVPSPSAEATISVFRTVFSQHGLPDIIVSDNGPAFTSSQYADFLNRNGIRRMMVPPYHPASNGAAEQVVQTIKDKLKKSTPDQPAEQQTTAPVEPAGAAAEPEQPPSQLSCQQQSSHWKEALSH